MLRLFFLSEASWLVISFGFSLFCVFLIWFYFIFLLLSLLFIIQSLQYIPPEVAELQKGCIREKVNLLQGVCANVCDSFSFLFIYFLCVVEVVIISYKMNTSAWAHDAWFLQCVLLYFRCWKWCFLLCCYYLGNVRCFFCYHEQGQYYRFQSFNCLTSWCLYNNVFFFLF